MARDILIVDDEADIRDLIAVILRDEGYQTRVSANSDETLTELTARRPSLLVLDIWLQGSRLDGLELLQAVKRRDPDLPVVMISGHGNIETAVQSIRLGAYDYIEKPFKTDRLLLIVQRAIEASRLARENRELRERVGHEIELIGAGSQINAVRGLIAKVAPTGSRVLISGPPGAGKEVAARMLHARSRRGDAPFVALNAATLEPDRVEEELFGIEDERHDAEEPRKIGVFEQAHGGTLFLDEVADMPLATQGKILRVLVDQEFTRIGGARRVEVDVRVVSASNRDLRREISAGRFREDLYHRLAVVPIEVPRLSARPEDVPALVDYFVDRTARTHGLTPRRITADAMATLQAHDWPGNVRQLRNVIESMLIMAPGEEGSPIDLAALPAEIVAPTPAALRAQEGGEVMTMPLREARELFEREYLRAQIHRFGGNISRTAEFVGMERSALHRKLKSLGVSARAQSGA